MRRSISKNLPAVILASFIVLSCSAEVPEQLTRNVQRLRITLVLERETYLPFEIPTATITLVNPTNVPLVVPRPFLTSTGTLVRAQRMETNQGVKWTTSEHWVSPTYDANTPTITMAPAETRQITFRADKDSFEGKYAEFDQPPGEPGRYRLNYMYTSSAEAAFFFRVENGDSIDHLVDVAVPGPRVPWYRSVLVIRQGAEYAVCVTRDGIDRPHVGADWVGNRYTSLGDFRQIRRVSIAPIVTFQALLDPQQRIVIRWTDNTGANRLAVVDLDLNVIP